MSKLIKLSREANFNGEVLTELSVREPLGSDITKVDIMVFVKALDFEKLSRLDYKNAADNAASLGAEVLQALKLEPKTQSALAIIAGRLTGTSADFIEKLPLRDNLIVLAEVGKLLILESLAALQDFMQTSA